jgi:NAD+ kinase
LKILIIYRPGSNDALAKSHELKTWLEKKGHKVFSHPQQRLKDCESLQNVCEAELAIALGGDGTYLEAVRMCSGNKVPILGINMGSLGFLTVSPIENLYIMVEKALNKELEERPRSLLEAQVGSQTFVALNDIVFERGDMSQLLNLTVKSGAHLVCDLKSDGLIFATPTGSTAYNLAAGGPILHPEVKAFAMTPICSHSLTSRPTVFADNHELKVEVNNEGQAALLTIDGQRRAKISSEQHVIIKRSEFIHYVLRQPSHNYFDLLRKKLRYGERP